MRKRCVYILLASQDFCSKTRLSSGKTTQVPLNRADAPMSNNWQLGMAPGWLCFQLDLMNLAENMAVVARFRLRSSFLLKVIVWNQNLRQATTLY